METQKPTHEDFLNDVPPIYRPFVELTHEYLLQSGCKQKLEQAKSGIVVSYAHTPTKRVIANFVFRKKGLIIRIYGDHSHRYEAFLETMPESMRRAVEKAPACKRLLDPAKCSSRCPMGYVFTLQDTLHKKCRYSSFMFPLEDESLPYIRAFLENELRERAAS